MKEFLLLPESLEPSEDSPDCEGDDLTLPRLVRRVNLHLICNTEEYLLAGSVLICDIFIWIPAISNNCNHETWRSYSFWIILGFKGCWLFVVPPLPNLLAHRLKHVKLSSRHSFGKGLMRKKQKGKPSRKGTNRWTKIHRKRKKLFGAKNMLQKDVQKKHGKETRNLIKILCR